MSSKKPQTSGEKLIAANRRAHHDYFIVERLEVGIELVGSELRPCREGRVNIKDSYAQEEMGQLWLYDMHIAENPFSNRLNHEAERKRRLLAHKTQILRWGKKAETAGMTIIPLKMYLKNGRVKVEIGLAKGKTAYDKRESIAKKDAKREIERELRGKF